MRSRRAVLLAAPLAATFALSLAVLAAAGDAPPWSDATGTGEPTIVLLHSAGSGPSVWDLLLPELSEKHRVVRVELPGHGASPAIRDVSVKEVARAVDRALEARKVEGALLVGHSYGGWVALEEAVAHPKRAAAVAMIDIGSYTPPDTARTANLEQHLKEHYPNLIRLIYESMSVSPVESDSAIAQAMRVAPDVLSAYLRDAWRTDLRRRIRGLKTPIHVIVASSAWPASQPWERVKTVLGYETAGPVTGVRISETGHLIMRDRPDSLAAVLVGIADALPKR
jgi:pimeloyl-ACP methyl ester carboxylesterase